MIDPTGIWDVTISTPIGKQHLILEITRQDGGLAGVARGDRETVPMMEVVQEGERLAWRQSVTKPLKLGINFDVTLGADSMTGKAKPTFLPSSPLNGTRVRS